MECGTCTKIMPIGSMLNQLLCSLRACIATFNESWMVCDDTTCGCRTRQIGVLVRKCPVFGCRGFLSLEYSAKAMLRQLQYYSKLVNVDAFVEKNCHDDGLRVSLLSSLDEKKKIAEGFAEEFKVLYKAVEGYLEKNACRTVDLKKFFGWMSLGENTAINA
jgi:DNA polymerase alpha subunit A